VEDREERTIYVIAASPDGPSKIGVANNTKKRLAQLQTGSDKLLTIFNEEIVRATHTLALERLIHTQLGHKRLKGEWFDINVEDAIAEVRFGIIRWESDDSLDRELRKKRLTKR
jgi:hypothetical protein